MRLNREIFFLAIVFVFLGGVSVGGCLSLLRPHDVNMLSDEPWQISSSWRAEEVDAMFAHFRAGRVIYTVMLPVLNTRIKVHVVSDQYRGADYGFFKLDQLPDPPLHFWYTRPGEYDMRKYDDNHVFVSLKSRYVHKLMNDPEQSGYTPSSAANELPAAKNDPSQP